MRILRSLLEASAWEGQTDRNLGTGRGLITFLRSLNMEPINNIYDHPGAKKEARYRRKGTLFKDLAPLKTAWNFKPEPKDRFDGQCWTLTHKVDPTKSLHVVTYPKHYSSITWDKDQFMDDADATKVNIYRVTKHHPAWMWVEDGLDQQFAGRDGVTRQDKIKVTRELVDDYMSYYKLTPAQLTAQIIARTKAGKVHSLYNFHHAD